MPSRLQRLRWKRPKRFTWVSHSFSSYSSLPDTCLWNVLTPTLSQHAPGGGSGQHCANNDCLLCSIRGSFSLSFCNLTMHSIKMACVGVQEGGAHCLTDSCVGCGHTLASTGVNVNDGTSIWLLDVLIGGPLVKWSCVWASVGGQFHVQQAVSVYSRQPSAHAGQLYAHPNLRAFSAGYGFPQRTHQPLQLCPTDWQLL